MARASSFTTLSLGLVLALLKLTAVHFLRMKFRPAAIKLFLLPLGSNRRLPPTLHWRMNSSRLDLTLLADASHRFATNGRDGNGSMISVNSALVNIGTNGVGSFRQMVIAVSISRD